MEQHPKPDPLDMGPTPSLLDLLKLERMWVNEPTPELEDLVKTRPRHHSHKEHRDRPSSITPSGAPKKVSSSSVPRPSSQMTAQRTRTPNKAPVSPLQAPVLVNEKYEVNTIYDPSMVQAAQLPHQRHLTTSRDDSHTRPSKRMSSKDKSSAMWKAMAGKPRSWGAEEYKEMKQYFMTWYIEVLKRQHETEHTKSGKTSTWVPEEEMTSKPYEDLHSASVNDMRSSESTESPTPDVQSGKLRLSGSRSEPRTPPANSPASSPKLRRVSSSPGNNTPATKWKEPQQTLSPLTVPRSSPARSPRAMLSPNSESPPTSPLPKTISRGDKSPSMSRSPSISFLQTSLDDLERELDNIRRSTTAMEEKVQEIEKRERCAAPDPITMLYGEGDIGSNPGSPTQSQLSAFSDSRPKSVTLKKLYFEKKASHEGLSIPVTLVARPEESMRSFKASPRSAFSPNPSPRSHTGFQSIVDTDDSRNDTEDEFRSEFTEGSESEN